MMISAVKRSYLNQTLCDIRRPSHVQVQTRNRAAFTNRRITRDPVVFSFPRMVNAFPASFNSRVSQGNSVASPPIPASTCLRNQHGVENFPIRFQADFSLSSE